MTTYPFKIIIYKCKCRYIQITDTEKRTMKNLAKCPVHRKTQDYVLLWCIDCGLRIEASPKAGHKQQRCYGCGEAQKRKINRELWKTRYKGRYNYHGQIKYSQKETQKQEKKRQLNEVFQKIRNRFRPPEMKGRQLWNI